MKLTITHEAEWESHPTSSPTEVMHFLHIGGYAAQITEWQKDDTVRYAITGNGAQHVSTRERNTVDAAKLRVEHFIQRHADQREDVGGYNQALIIDEVDAWAEANR